MEKAVVLARGLGKRMRRGDEGAHLDAKQAAVADTGVKAMIPIGRPFLDYVLSALADAGYKKVCLVVGPEHDGVRRYYEHEQRPRRVSVDFAIQVEPRGTADAVAAAEPFAGDDPFLVINSDNYYPAAALKALREATGPALAGFERDALIQQSNIPAERVVSFAVLEVDPSGALRSVIEKPDAATLARMPEPLYVSMNCWRFDRTIFTGCRSIGPSPRGELELTAAAQYAVEKLGTRFAVLPVRAGVLDLSSRGDIEEVGRRLAGVEVRP